MKRRDFIKRVGPAVTVPFVLNGLPINAYSRRTGLESFLRTAAETDRVLVLIQLSGGNDGINTVLPLDQYASYQSLRANIAIPESKALVLKPGTGLHPAMSAVHTMYQNGQMAVVQGVCYPNPNLSHFRATDIWLTGSDYNQYLRDGWLGRYLDGEFPGYPTGYPNAQMPDPLAIQIGAVVSPALQGSAQMLGIAITDPSTFYALVNGGKPGGLDDPPAGPAGKELEYIRGVQLESQQYSTAIKTAADKAQNKATYPTQNTLADQLKIVARLVAGGLRTPIYIVTLGGFDTHAAQVATDTTTGTHATLLGRLSEAVSAFHSDLAANGVADRVVSMTFSEFGRRVQSNASEGTDHGTAAPVLVFGSKVLGGIIGGNPSLTSLDNGNLKMQHDYRQVYASLLSQWFEASPSETQAALFKQYTQVPIIRGGASSAEAAGITTGFRLEQNYPNPFNPATNIHFTVPRESDVVLRVYDARGHFVATLAEGRVHAGTHRVTFDAAGLASGVYTCRLMAEGYAESRSMVLTR